MSNPFPFPSPITTGTYQSSISTDRSWSVDLPSLRTPTYQLLPPPLNDCTVGLALRLSTLVWPTLKYLPIKSKCIKSNVKLILCQNRVCSLVNTKEFFFQEEAMEQKNHMKTKKKKTKQQQQQHLPFCRWILSPQSQHDWVRRTHPRCWIMSRDSRQNLLACLVHSRKLWSVERKQWKPTHQARTARVRWLHLSCRYTHQIQT